MEYKTVNWLNKNKMRFIQPMEKPPEFYRYEVNGKKSYYSIDINDKEKLIKYLKFYKENCSNHYGLTKKEIDLKASILTNDEFFSLLKKYYVESQIGIKSLIKLLDNVLTYSIMRGILVKFGILRTQNNYVGIFTEEQKKMRSYNAKNGITLTWLETASIYDKPHLSQNSNKQGIQGFYFSKKMNKYIWLRSTYEYMFIDWLEKFGINYIFEGKTFVLNDGRKYRPDFLILNKKNEVEIIIELKSNYYVSHQDDKGFLLNDEQNIPVKVLVGIDEMKNYTDSNIMNYGIALKEWKKLRMTKEQLDEKLKN